MKSFYCSQGRLCAYIVYLFLAYLLLTCWRPIYGQPPKQYITPLKIGDHVPDIILSEMINYQTTSVNTTEFHGKALILDFWASWCGPCITMLPRLDSLQRQFSKQLTILPVSYQSKKEVLAFNEKYYRQKGLRIDGPAVTGDAVLKRYFPHNTIPHYVWIDAKGVVKSITGSETLTSENIFEFLAEGSANLAGKKYVPSLGYQSGKTPLLNFLRDNETDRLGQFSFHSFFTQYIPGLGGGEIRIKTEADSSRWRITFTNISILSLFQFAFGEGRKFLSSNAIAVEVADSSRFFWKKQLIPVLDWMEKNTYCYELVVPGNMPARGYAIFRDDLKHQLSQYEARIEKRETKVLALVTTLGKYPAKSEADTYSENYDGFTYRLRHGLLSSFVIGLNARFMQDSPMQVVDQTGFTEFVDLDISCNMSKVDELNKELVKYGLRLTEKSQPTEILVIRDNLPQKRITP